MINLRWKSFDFSCDTSFNFAKCLIPTSPPQLIHNNKCYHHIMNNKSKYSHRNIFNCDHFGCLIFKKTLRNCHFGISLLHLFYLTRRLKYMGWGFNFRTQDSIFKTKAKSTVQNFPLQISQDLITIFMYCSVELLFKFSRQKSRIIRKQSLTFVLVQWSLDIYWKSFR